MNVLQIFTTVTPMLLAVTLMDPLAAFVTLDIVAMESPVLVSNACSQYADMKSTKFS